MQVDRSKLQHTLKHRIDHYTAEASELGLRPGQWPESLTVQGLGNGLPFHVTRQISSDSGEFGGFVYSQQFGCIGITVFND